MNKVILMGRLTREPDVRYSQNADGSMAVARYTLAVDRRRARNLTTKQIPYNLWVAGTHHQLEGTALALFLNTCACSSVRSVSSSSISSTTFFLT